MQTTKLQAASTILNTYVKSNHIAYKSVCAAVKNRFLGGFIGGGREAAIALFINGDAVEMNEGDLLELAAVLDLAEAGLSTEATAAFRLVKTMVLDVRNEIKEKPFVCKFVSYKQCMVREA